MWLLFLILPYICIADRCASIPPTLWCNNQDIIKECGFEQLCGRYHSSTFNKPVNITVFIEALCPDCQNFILDELYPNIYKNFGSYVNIEFVPYGNAKIVNDSIVCQHGPEECQINRFESCLIDSVQTQDQYVPLIYCIEKQLKEKVSWEKATETCFRTLSVGDDIQRMIQSCLVSRLGEKLQQKAAERTSSAYPNKHNQVPWILINDISLLSAQKLMKNLPEQICQWYSGDKPIPYCKAQQRRIKACKQPFKH